MARVVSEGGLPQRLSTVARKLDRGIQVNELNQSGDRRLFDFLLRVIEKRVNDQEVISSRLIEKLERIGFLIPRRRVRDLFGKLDYIWDGALDDLVPIRFRRRRVPQADELMVNPTLEVGRRLKAIPDAASREALDNCIRATDRVVTIVEPGSLIINVFPFSNCHASQVEMLRRRTPVSELGLTRQHLRRLWIAGLLVRQADWERAKRRWWKHELNGPRELAAKGYLRLSNICNPFLLAAMRKHYRSEIADGRLEFGDAQSQRWKVHGEPLARYFHLQLTNAISRVSGQQQKPSYVYFGSYVGGAELKRHVDRAQSELAVSFLVDFTPEPRSVSPWPLYIEGKQEPLDIHAEYQALGDALVYRGKERPHYRPPLMQECTSSSLFLMYVAEDFEGDLQ